MKYSVVYTGDVRSGTAPMKIESNGIGSCVSLTLYDATRRNGGMAHIMLPGKPNQKKDEDQLVRKVGKNSTYMRARYAREGIGELLADLSKLGSGPENLVATLTGGAEMFPDLGELLTHIGDRNVDAIEKELVEHGIKIEKREVGGEKGRSVVFNLEDGSTIVETTGKQ